MAQTVYWVIVPAGDSAYANNATDAAKIKDGLRQGGSAATASGSEADPDTAGTINIDESTPATGLTAGASYRIAATIWDGTTYGGGSAGPTYVVESASFTALAIVSNDLNLAYDILASVSSDLALSYAIRSIVESSLSIAYDVRQAVAADLAISYAVHEAVEADLGIAFDIRASVQSDLALVYDIDSATTSVTSDLVVAYSILSSVTVDLAVSYDVRAEVANDLALAYSIQQSIERDLALTYSVYNSVESDLVLVYDVDAYEPDAPGTISHDLLIRYNVVGKPGAVVHVPNAGREQRDLPPIPDHIADSLARPLKAIREALQVILGRRGDDLDAVPRWRDLIGRGFATTALAPANTGDGAVGPPGPPGPPGDGVEPPDLTAPPTVTGLSVAAGFAQVIVSWTGIGYTQGHGNKQTIIYAVKSVPGSAYPTFPGEPGRVAVAPHALTTIAIPSELNTRWHIWAKFESNDGVLSTNPAGGVNGYNFGGAFPTTGEDVTQLLEILNGQITESELYATLGARIDLIDGGGAGSVNARIAVESTSRTALDTSVHALYTVRAEVSAAGRTVVGGFGLSATALQAGGTAIDFGVRADKFWIAAPSTATGVPDRVPFVVKTTATEDGDVTLPAGVYMDAAFIVNLTAQYARFQTLIADDITTASLSAAQLTVGTGVVGGDLRSTAYSAGSGATPGAGWRIRPDGSAEFNNATVRGTIYAQAANIQGTLVASQINSNGLVIRDNAGTVILNANVTGVGSATFSGNATGSLNGTAAATVVSGAADGASANAAVNDATTGLAAKLSATERKVLAGGGGVAIGSITWNGAGVYSSGYGIALTAAGILAKSSAGGNPTTFALDAATGNATFAGTLSAASGSLGSLTLAAGGYIAAVKASYASASAGFFLGYEAGVPVFNIGDVNNYLKWNGTTLQYTGTMLGTATINGTAASTVVTGAAAGAVANAAISDATTGLNARLSAEQADILNARITLGAVGNAGMVAGTLQWNSSGGWISGQGVAITPGGILGHNGTNATFSINASTGAATFAGDLSAATGSFAGLVSVGSFAGGYGFPASGTGASLSAAGGLRLGNSSRAFEVTPAGDMYAGPVGGPYAFQVVNGVGTFGALTVSASGNIKGGQTAYATGAGFWLGMDGGTPKFSIGDGTKYLRWTGLALDIKGATFDAMTAAISGGGAITHTTASTGTFAIGSRGATPSGGTAPYSYAWTVVPSGGEIGGASMYLSGESTSSVSVWSRLPITGAGVVATIRCVVTDANGRTASASFSASSQNTA